MVATKRGNTASRPLGRQLRVGSRVYVQSGKYYGWFGNVFDIRGKTYQVRLYDNERTEVWLCGGILRHAKDMEYYAGPPVHVDDVTASPHKSTPVVVHDSVAMVGLRPGYPLVVTEGVFDKVVGLYRRTVNERIKLDLMMTTVLRGQPTTRTFEACHVRQLTPEERVGWNPLMFTT